MTRQSKKFAGLHSSKAGMPTVKLKMGCFGTTFLAMTRQLLLFQAITCNLLITLTVANS